MRLTAFVFILSACAATASQEATKRIYIGDDLLAPLPTLIETIAAAAKRPAATALFVSPKNAASLAAKEPYDDAIIQIRGHQTGGTPTEEAAALLPIIRALREANPKVRIFLLQTWADGADYWDDMNQSWDAHSWFDNTERLIAEHQAKVVASVRKAFGEQAVSVIPAGQVMMSVHEAIMDAGMQAPFMSASAMLADFGMSRKLSRPGLYLVALTCAAHIHKPDVVKTAPAEAMIAAKYLDPPKGEIILSPEQLALLRRLAGKSRGTDASQ